MNVDQEIIVIILDQLKMWYFVFDGIATDFLEFVFCFCFVSSDLLVQTYLEQSKVFKRQVTE